MEELSFFPRKKIEIVKNKLNGVNPINIVAKELKDSKHHRKAYFK